MKPTKKQLEIIAFALPWQLLCLLPENIKDRDIFITKIIEIWEKIKNEKPL